MRLAYPTDWLRLSLPQYLTLIGAGLLICNWRFSQMAFSRVCFYPNCLKFKTG
nr:MAG TPA: hypothetical protein [Caudoviricetes sp.]